MYFLVLVSLMMVAGCEGDAVLDAEYQKAFSCAKANDFECAREIAEPLAEQGYYKAQHMLGVMNYRGEGVDQDYAKAMMWYKKAANQGYALSQNNVGLLYREGRGVKKDYVVAAAWYAKSAEQGLLIAQVSLANLYSQGLGVTKNIDQARKWYKKAAAQGDDYAKKRLAKLAEAPVRTKDKALVGQQWDGFGGSSDMAAVMAEGYNQPFVEPYATLIVLSEDIWDSGNPHGEMHMFSFNIPTTLSVCKRKGEVELGPKNLIVNEANFTAKARCKEGMATYSVTEESPKGIKTPLDAQLRSGNITMTFPEGTVMTFPSAGYSQWVDSSLTKKYKNQAAKDKENKQLAEFYTLHKAKATEAQEALAKLFWCEDMGYNMSRFKDLVERMLNFAVKHSHTVTYHRTREELDRKYDGYPRSVALDICQTAGYTRHTF